MELTELEEYRQTKYAVLCRMQEQLYRPDELKYRGGLWMIICAGDYQESRILGPTMRDALRALG